MLSLLDKIVFCCCTISFNVKIGVPLVDATFFYRYPRLSPPMVGAVAYGALAGVLGAMSGKSI